MTLEHEYELEDKERMIIIFFTITEKEIDDYTYFNENQYLSGFSKTCQKMLFSL